MDGTEIIGRADGPTEIFVSSFGLYWIAGVAVAIFVCGFIVGYIVKRRKINRKDDWND